MRPPICCHRSQQKLALGSVTPRPVRRRLSAPTTSTPSSTSRQVGRGINPLLAGTFALSSGRARGKSVTTRLDEADAKLEVWKAKANQKRAQHAMKRNDELTMLEKEVRADRWRVRRAIL